MIRDLQSRLSLSIYMQLTNFMAVGTGGFMLHLKRLFNNAKTELNSGNFSENFECRILKRPVQLPTDQESRVRFPALPWGFSLAENYCTACAE